MLPTNAMVIIVAITAISTNINCHLPLHIIIAIAEIELSESSNGKGDDNSMGEIEKRQYVIQKVGVSVIDAQQSN